MFLYNIVSSLFSLIRQFCVSNPFDVLGVGISVTVYGTPFPLPPEFLNILAEPLMFVFTRGVVRCYYASGSAPLGGCCLYMFFYLLHTDMLRLLLIVYPSTGYISLIGGIYVAFHILFVVIRNKISSILRVYKL